MATPRHKVRMLLIQVRDHAEAAEQERLCFLERCRLEPQQMRVHNVVLDPSITWDAAAGTDVVMIGGAGSHSVIEEHPFTPPLWDFTLRLLEEEAPLFGSCWGHQFLARVLGGTVVQDLEGAEIGTFDIRKTAAGLEDPLLAYLPPVFPVQLGHHDRIDRPPEGIEVLATSGPCPHQIIRVAGRPVYGSQFHSEMTDEHMRARVHMYRDEYLEDDEAVAAFEARLRPSPDADLLLDRFLELYV